MTVLLFLGIALLSYFLGGINGAIITTRLVYHDDIRRHNSGNPGLTNFHRTFGGKAVFLVVLIDVLKTAIPVVLGGYLLERYADFGTAEYRVTIGRTLAGFFAMLGHAYPCLYGFKGGKCVMAGGTVALFMDWRVAALVWSAFLLAVIFTRYISLGSVLAALLFPVAFFLLGYTDPLAMLLACLCGGLLIYRHHENIVRLVRGEERKFSFKRSGTSTESTGAGKGDTP